MKKTISITTLLVLLLATALPSIVTAKVTSEFLGYNILAETLNPNNLITVKDFNVIDGDTADFILDRENEPSIKARFLLIDTPELNKNEPYAKEAKNRVRELLKSADTIQIEYEGPEKDHYQRDLVHVWVDGILLQEILVSEGLAIARYIDGYLPNSEYVETIYASQDYAAQNNYKVWNNGKPEYLAKAEGLTNTASTVADVTNETDTTGNVAPTTFVSPEVYEEPVQENVYYENCTAVRNAGAAPIYPGDPGFQSKFDRDNDGIGCE